MKKSFLFKSFLSLLGIVFIIGCNTDHERSKAAKPANKEEHLKVAVPDHVVIVIEENHSYSQIIGSPAAPYITTLSKDTHSANFLNAYATTHPSQPNYLDLFSGSTQGVTNNTHPAKDPFIAPNLGSELISAGKSFCTYAEGLPSVGYNGDFSGAYVRKHNPSANWMGSGTNQIPATTNQPFTSFPTDYAKLPTVSIIIPNDNHNMHDGSIGAGDQWLKEHLDNYVQWAKNHNSLFILTYDEDDNYHGNHIVTIFTGSMIKSGQYEDAANHFNVLRTIEEIYGLPYTGYAATAKPITDCWK